MATQFSEQALPVRAYDLVATGSSYLQSVVLLLARLAWGWESYLSGYGHLHNVPSMVEFFRSLNVPMPVASVYVSAITELAGGLLLMFGFATRLVAVPLAFNFLVAILTAGSDGVKQAIFGGDHFKKYDAGHLGGLNAVIDDTAFPFLIVSLLVLAFGPGKASVDYLLQRVVLRRRRDRLDEPSRFGPGPAPDVGDRRREDGRVESEII